MKKFLICLIFIINFHAHGETTWIECDIDNQWKKEGNENRLEADYQEYFVVNTKPVKNNTFEVGVYQFDKISGKVYKVVGEGGIHLKHIDKLYDNGYSLNRETLYLERLWNGSLKGKCKLIKEVEWINITQNLIKETIKGNKF